MLVAVKTGYRITHRILLCWTKTPAPSERPRIRGLFLAVEATFTMAFHAVVARPSTDDKIEHLHFWSSKIVAWVRFAPTPP